eukprot:TRINITY_DN33841_c0_g1_i1.p1 TRINITY_DN33841_c0_g1~~TRINITY_DN33841_c0_g1_i1.p1  ORF type:complete len:417 (-),score=11.86 TRINITY_DN33841_c0_g1_i1:130-1278(-)
MVNASNIQEMYGKVAPSLLCRIFIRFYAWIVGGLEYAKKMSGFSRLRHDWLFWLISTSATYPSSDKNGVVSKDFTYPSHLDGYQNIGRVYTPMRALSELRPVIIFIHGGGWTICSCRIFFYDLYCKYLCWRTNSYVVSIDYRMAPEHPFPVPVEDCFSILEWLAHDYLVVPYADKSRVVLMGESAGGNMAAVMSMMYRDRNPRGITVIHQVLMYPCMMKRPLMPSRTDPLLVVGSPLPQKIMLQFENMYTPEGETEESLSTHPYVSPENANSLGGLPAVTGLIGGLDILHDEVVSYFNTLDAAGCEIDWRQWDRATHGFCIRTPDILMRMYACFLAFVTSQPRDHGLESMDYIVDRLDPLLEDLRVSCSTAPFLPTTSYTYR